MKGLEIIEIFAALLTAVGVVFVAIQFRSAKNQSQVSFEDNFTRQYRDIIQRISVRTLLNESLSDELFETALNELYNYFDLTNEQIFLRKQRRVTTETWNNWCDGIKSNMALPAFRRAWDLIKPNAPNYFEELRRLEKSGYEEDPIAWNRKGIVLPRRLLSRRASATESL